MGRPPSKHPWPPSDHVWRRILEDLPRKTEPEERRFRDAVGAAIQIYLDGGNTDVEQWQRIIKSAKSKSVESLVREINKLNPVRHSMAAQFMQGWAKGLKDVIEIAEFNALFAATKRQKRPERFKSNLLIACTEVGGLRLSVSSEGPLARVMKEILDLVLVDPPGERAIKAAIERERDRRAKGIKRPRTVTV